MEDIRILKSNGVEMAFRGELLAKAETERSDSDPSERRFDLRVYRTDDRGFVPIIEFDSTFENENAVTIAEFVDQSHDIENFFFVFEPSEVFTETTLRTLPTPERQQLLREMLSMYDSVVNSVLIQLRRHCLEGECDPEIDEPKKRKGLLGYLGL